MTGEPSATDVVQRATEHPILRVAARAGYLISGILHLLIGYIIVRVATGAGGTADQSGALTTLAKTSGGAAALWLVAVAIIPLGLWRLAEAVVGLHPGETSPPHPGDTAIVNRLKAFGLALVYGAVAFTAVRFAAGRHKPSSEENAGLSARLMQSAEGKTVLVAIGLGITAVGGYYAYKGASRKFVADLSVPCGPVLTALGVCGYVAEGLVLAAAGILVIVASVSADPSKATGLDGAVKTLNHGPFGTVVLLCAAAGFAAYGLYSFALTRCSRM